MPRYVAMRNFHINGIPLTVNKGQRVSYEWPFLSVAGVTYRAPEVRATVEVGWLELEHTLLARDVAAEAQREKRRFRDRERRAKKRLLAADDTASVWDFLTADKDFV